MTQRACRELRSLLPAARAKSIELKALKAGLIASPAFSLAMEPTRQTMNAAIDQYLEYIRKHRSLRTYRTYRPLLNFLFRDYVVSSNQEGWLSSPLEAFGGRSPRELISEGRIREMVVEFDRLREAQPV